MKGISKRKLKGMLKLFSIMSVVLIAFGIANYCTSVTGDNNNKINIAESLWVLKVVVYSMGISGIVTGIVALIRLFIKKS